jgi:hypothetical protein
MNSLKYSSGFHFLKGMERQASWLKGCSLACMCKAQRGDENPLNVSPLAGRSIHFIVAADAFHTTHGG